MYIKDILNKIKYSIEDINKYKIYYYDRVLQKNLRFDFKEIKNINKSFIEVDGKDIPLHRIREIRKDGKLIWER